MEVVAEFQGLDWEHCSLVGRLSFVVAKVLWALTKHVGLKGELVAEMNCSVDLR